MEDLTDSITRVKGKRSEAERQRLGRTMILKLKEVSSIAEEMTENRLLD